MHCEGFIAQYTSSVVDNCGNQPIKIFGAGGGAGVNGPAGTNAVGATINAAAVFNDAIPGDAPGMAFRGAMRYKTAAAGDWIYIKNAGRSPDPNVLPDWCRVFSTDPFFPLQATSATSTTRAARPRSAATMFFRGRRSRPRRAASNGHVPFSYKETRLETPDARHQKKVGAGRGGAGRAAMSVVVRTGRYIGTVAEQAAELFVGTLNVLSLVIAASWSIFYVGAVGIVLVLMRNWFMANAQTLADNAALWTGVINGLVDVVIVLGDIVGLIISFIGGIASLFSGNPAFPPFHPLNATYVNTTEFEKACVELPRACAGIDTPGRMFELALTPVASNATCGFFRYVYPAEWIFDIVYPVGRALYLTYPPFPPGTGPNTTEFGNNCACPDSYGCTYQWQCIVLGSGYWLLEFILPMILLGCVWQGWVEHVLKLAAALALMVATLARWLVAGVLRQLGRTVVVVDRAVAALTARLWDSPRLSGAEAEKKEAAVRPAPPPPSVPAPPSDLETAGLIGF